MERLTYWNKDMECWSYHGPSVESAIRLAAYEDTGLEPKEVKEFLEDVESRFILWVNKRYGMPTTEFMDIMQAEKDGRLVVLPCKPGDKVYQTNGFDIYESKVKRIVFETDNIGFSEDAIGKSVFLTRKEAEAALK